MPSMPDYILQIFCFLEGHCIDCMAPRHAGYSQPPTSWVVLIDRLIDIFLLIEAHKSSFLQDQDKVCMDNATQVDLYGHMVTVNNPHGWSEFTEF